MAKILEIIEANFGRFMIGIVIIVVASIFCAVIFLVPREIKVNDMDVDTQITIRFSDDDSFYDDDDEEDEDVKKEIKKSIK